MSEFICPRTGEPCELGSVCEAETIMAQALVRDWSYASREEQQRYLDQLGAKQYTLKGGVIRPLTPQEIKLRQSGLPSAEYAGDLAELNAHLAVEKRLPFPGNPEDPEAPCDSYDQLSQTVCLYGTARAIESIAELDEDERAEAMANLFLWAHHPGSISDTQ